MTRFSNRRGLTITELIVGMVILAVVGMALTRVMLSQARYFSHQKQGNLARNVSRGPLNRLVSDIRMVEALGGVEAASSTSFTARVPYAMGVVCSGSGSNGTNVSLLPVDSAMYAAPGFSGFAWRNGEGIYTYISGGSVAAGDVTACNTVGINTLTSQGAKVILLKPTLTDSASVGTVVFLYRRIRYEFKASQLVPNGTGLYRRALDGGAEEELSAPYANSASFKYFVGNSLVSQVNPPLDLSTIRGVELNMTGLSEKIPRQALAQEAAPFVTAVFFKNRLN